MEKWEELFRKKILESSAGDDPAHDLLHFKRVVSTARQLCIEEGANLEVVIPAAWLHDLVNVPKNDPRRSMASRLSAQAAKVYLESIKYPSQYIDSIGHAIECHSFSANITPLTIEAKIVQDADRLDGLGAIGIARCFATAGVLKRPLYSELDPFCKTRQPEDLKYSVDHFYQKHFKVANSLQTEAGFREGQRRIEVIRSFLSSMSREIGL